MRTLLLLASLFLPVLAVAAGPQLPEREDIGVHTVTVDLEGVGADVTVGGASMNRGWLVSWTRNASEHRDVTLLPVGIDGRPGQPTTYHDCTLTGFSDVQRKRVDGIESIKIRCAN